MLLLLRLNGYSLTYSQDDLIKLGYGIADGTIDEVDIRQWIEQHKS